MTDVMMGNMPCAETARTGVYEMLEGIRTMDDPNDQFLALERSSPYSQCRLPLNLTALEINYLFDFAADPLSSDSLLVRAQAIDTAIGSLDRALGSPEQDLLLMIRKAEVALLLGVDNIDAVRWPLHPSGHDDFEPHPYRNAAYKLAIREGIKQELLFPDWYVFSDEPGDARDCNPSAALFLLKNLALLQDTSQDLPITDLIKLVPLALDIQKALGDDFVDIDHLNQRCLREDSKEIVAFLGLEKKEVDVHLETIAGLYEAAIGLKDIFPREYARGIEQGAQSLISSCLYAIRAHVEHDHSTSVELPLNGSSNRSLPLHLKGDEPLAILQSLESAMCQIHDIVQASGSATTQVSKSAAYKLFRIWPEHEKGSRVSVYIRPRGAYSFDPQVEYGTADGVEASIGFIIDPTLPAGGLLPVGRAPAQQPDNRISIRLDREGILPQERGVTGVTKDPKREQGTLSLDIGSVLGNESGLVTKIGRFLAWGNLLRSQAVGEATQLNHVTRYFSDLDGRADIFAARARGVIEQLEARGLNKKQLAERLSGAAVMGHLEQAE